MGGWSPVASTGRLARVILLHLAPRGRPRSRRQRQVLGLVRLIKEDATLGTVAAEPPNDLLETRRLAAARDQRRVRDEQYAAADAPTRAVARGHLVDLAVGKPGQRMQRHAGRPNVLEIAPSVFEEVLADGDPHVTPAQWRRTVALSRAHVVQDEACELTAFAQANAVTKEEARALARGQVGGVPTRGVRDRLELQARQRATQRVGGTLGAEERRGQVELLVYVIGEVGE